MESKFFSEYEEVLILVNVVRYKSDYNKVFEKLEGKRSKISIKRRYDDYIRYYPYRVEEWTPYEDYWIRLWGNMEDYVDPWNWLALNFNRRAMDIKTRYKKLMTGVNYDYESVSPKSVQVYQRGKRIIDVSKFVIQNNIETNVKTIKEFVNILKLFDDQVFDQAMINYKAKKSK